MVTQCWMRADEVIVCRKKFQSLIVTQCGAVQRPFFSRFRYLFWGDWRLQKQQYRCDKQTTKYRFFAEEIFSWVNRTTMRLPVQGAITTRWKIILFGEMYTLFKGESLLRGIRLLGGKGGDERLELLNILLDAQKCGKLGYVHAPAAKLITFFCCCFAFWNLCNEAQTLNRHNLKINE